MCLDKLGKDLCFLVVVLYKLKRLIFIIQGHKGNNSCYHISGYQKHEVIF
jgi:hypothetical protein